MTSTGVPSSKAIRRRQLAPLTEIRAERLRHALTLFEVAREAGLSCYRVSIIERDPDLATPEELRSLREAIGRLAIERGRGRA